MNNEQIAKDTPERMANSNARFSIDGAIQFGRENRNPLPSEEHWLYEYWNIGRQLAKLGETGWDNVTPMPPSSAPVAIPGHPEHGWVWTKAEEVEITRWGQQQRDAGKREGWDACCNANQEHFRQLRDRAEKAEALVVEARAMFDLMLEGCADQKFGDYENGHGETIGPRMDSLHALLAQVKPKGCTGTPACCPDNEGYGCSCSPMVVSVVPVDAQSKGGA
jgi:hypothetical protein